jgi:hypothetical protein
MKKLILSFILMLSIFTTLLVPTSIAVASNPDDEIATLRKTIKFVHDIDTETYKRLETAILKKYTDVIKDDWYMSVMVKLVGLSALDGSLNNTLDPTGTVTKAMFIKMFIRAMYGTEGLDNITPDFIHWAAKDVKKAENIGILAQGEYTLSNLSDSITRGEMAKIIVRAYRKYETNPLTVEKCKPLSKQIKDYDQMTEEQKSNALLVYGSGIISGYPDGRFAPNDNANRAQASAIIIRYLDKSERAKVVIPFTEATREPMILRYDDPNRPIAIEGDTFVKPDGTKVVLKIGPSGVLGEEQGCATEIGRAHPNGKLIEHGDLCSNEKFLGQPYLVDEKTGEGHYIREWHAIADRLGEEAIEKLGHPAEGTTYGPWLLYKYGQWCWVGPVP